MSSFEFKVNLKEIADQVGKTSEEIAKRVNEEVRKLSMSTHAFVVQYANSKLEGFKRNYFFGKDNENVRWVEIAENMWVVEIDPKAAWIEEGREEVSMATDKWLLKPGKVKRAKDGSTYRSIPFTHSKPSDQRRNPELAGVLSQELRRQGIDLKKVDYEPNGQPKLGIVRKIGFSSAVTQKSSANSMFFSAKRDPKDAQRLGLPPYQGAHYLQGAVVTQRMDNRGKVKRDVVTFRTVSSKHQNEDRWRYPKVEPLNSIPAAYEYANTEWKKIVSALEQEFSVGS